MPTPLGAALLQAQSAAGVAPLNRATVVPTNYVQANSDYNTAMEAAYQAKLAQQNAMWGGLAGLGAAGILASPKLLGPAATAAASPAATPVASNALDSLMLNGGTTGAPLSLAAPGAVADSLAAGDATSGLTAAGDAAASGGLDLASLLALFA